METALPVPCLVILVGPSSSGKSTWAAENFASSEIVSSDELRSRVGIVESDQLAGSVAFELLETIVAERLRRQLTTVIDTTGLDRERRLSWIGSAETASIPVFAAVFDTDLDTCLARNDSRGDRHPRGVVRNQHRRMKHAIAEIEEESYAAVLREAVVNPTASSVVTSKQSKPEPEPRGRHTFGLIVPRFDWGGDTPFAETLRSIATRAEEAGFRDIWLMDHFRQIQSVGRPWEDIPEPYTTLGYLAGATTTIRLGCLVTSVTHRHPAVLAQMIATLDVLSGGRAVCGLGIGWDEEEHKNFGIPFPEVTTRYELVKETVDVLRLMWGKGTPEYKGKHFQADSLACYPRPVQDPIPILIGGSGEKKTLLLVARLADAANVFGTPERVAHKVGVLREHCRAVDRDFEEIEVTHLVNAITAPDRAGLRAQVDWVRPASVSFEDFVNKNNGALPADLIGLFGAYSDAGADHSIVSLPNAHLDGGIEAFAEVISGMR
ncbi:MAG: TIGR03560 family F420-dependent LLM class oxidoreductase [Acidimicrobiia bacterium]